MNVSGSAFMGDYGLYVWGAYLLTLGALGGEVLLLLRRRKVLRDSINGAACRGGWQAQR
jgi:heme exporter protein CcmD